MIRYIAATGYTLDGCHQQPATCGTCAHAKHHNDLLLRAFEEIANSTQAPMVYDQAGQINPYMNQYKGRIAIPYYWACDMMHSHAPMIQLWGAHNASLLCLSDDFIRAMADQVPDSVHQVTEQEYYIINLHIRKIRPARLPAGVLVLGQAIRQAGVWAKVQYSGKGSYLYQAPPADRAHWVRGVD